VHYRIISEPLELDGRTLALQPRVAIQLVPLLLLGHMWRDAGVSS
jgi:hypothetical protein